MDTFTIFVQECSENLLYNMAPEHSVLCVSLGSGSNYVSLASQVLCHDQNFPFIMQNQYLGDAFLYPPTINKSAAQGIVVCSQMTI